jgi:hypothetical protein
MSFLTGSWENLILANYTVNKQLLLPHVPKGTMLDSYKGAYYVSLVGFLFKDTKLLGVPVPFHRNFEEVNLRFYVKYFENNTWKRGVVFIKELVPKPALTFVANTIYKEHYQTVPMQHKWTKSMHDQTICYAWDYEKVRQNLQVKASLNSKKIASGTAAEFITEHYFGYTKYNNTTFEYEVIHPKWEHYEVMDYAINIDFKNNYGTHFSVLNRQNPHSVLLCKGSKISVENKRKISW